MASESVYRPFLYYSHIIIESAGALALRNHVLLVIFVFKTSTHLSLATATKAVEVITHIVSGPARSHRTDFGRHASVSCRRLFVVCCCCCCCYLLSLLSLLSIQLSQVKDSRSSVVTHRYRGQRMVRENTKTKTTFYLGARRFRPKNTRDEQGAHPKCIGVTN